MARDIAIVLSSGGMNSCIVTALAAQRFRPIMLHGEIPGPAGARLRAAYEQQVGHFKPYRDHTVPLPAITSTAAQAGQAQAAASDPRQENLLATQMLDLLPVVACAARVAAQYQAAAVYFGLSVGPTGDD